MAKRKSTTETVWRNRIVGHADVAPSELTEHFANWRQHPDNQSQALAAVLDNIGWIQNVIVSKNTGRIIDGHLRAKLAASRNEPTIPVIYVDLTEQEELTALATIDPLSAMAVTDDKLLAQLIAAIEDDSALNAVLDTLAQDNTDAAPHTDGQPAEDAPPVEFQPYVYPADNEWGVPTLMLSKQAPAMIEPVHKWGSVSRTTKIEGTWHFYTDDYKFANVWTEPMQPVLTRCRAIVEPNYSTHHAMPRAEVLWGIYRKRWLNRFWQDAGMMTFVDVNVEREYFDIALLGVPTGWRAYANRAYTADVEHLEAGYALACDRAGTEEIVYMVYGGRKPVQDVCVERGWAWVPEDSYVKHGR